MKTTSHLWRKGSLVVPMLSLLGLVSWGVANYGNALGLDTPGKKFFSIFLSILSIVMFRYLPTFSRYAKQILYRTKGRKEGVYPENENRLSQTSSDISLLVELGSTLKAQYGRFWRAKTRIILIAGTPSDIEQLVPGLVAQHWVEGSGVVLIRGNDLTRTPDAAWLEAIRKLHRRPLDGVLWVTSEFQNKPALLSCAQMTSMTAAQMDDITRHLQASFKILGWRVPLYLWSLQEVASAEENATESATCLLPAICTVPACRAQLGALKNALTEQGTQHLTHNIGHNFLLKLAELLSRHTETLTDLLASFFNPHRQVSLAGMIFSPPSIVHKQHIPHAWSPDTRWDALLNAFPALPAPLRAQRIALSWHQIVMRTTAGLLMLWGAGMVCSFIANRNMIAESLALAELATGPDQPLSRRLTALSTLQQMPGRLLWRQQNGIPWYYRFGLDHHEALQDALWPRYARSAIPLLRDEAAKHLTLELTALTRLAPASPQFSNRAKVAYNQLKMYLMLTRPEQMDAAFFSQMLMKDWPERKGIDRAAWQAIGPELLHFWGKNLPQHPEWKLQPDKNLISQVRTLLIRQMGIRNGEAALYQKIIEQVSPHYTDLRLEDMTGDTRAENVFYTSAIVPGVFTRKAWEEEVRPAIEKLRDGRREEVDQVLGDDTRSATDPLSPEALEAQLTARYFADFSGCWQDFLNSIRWQRAQTLSDAIDQLTLIADIRQSPLVSLMNTLSVQGRTGMSEEGLSDSLVKSAKDLFSGSERLAIDQNTGRAGPMDDTFAPILALMENKTGGQDTSRLNLQTYLTRVTQVRLKLQQITNAADPQAMSQALAQTVFQGKTIDLTQTRDYGNLVAASLGQAWSGFGQAMFVQPLEQSWQQILQPTAAGLNAKWKRQIVDDWDRAFGGRYPFQDVSSEVSLPLLAHYLRNDNGRISRFLEGQLSGVLHKEGSHWVADTVNAQGLVFNPAFLDAMDRLSQLADEVFIRGDAGLRFDLRPGTARDVMQTDLILDGQKLSYVNQMPAWKSFVWPADTDAPGGTLSWISTKTGTRIYADMPGTWGWIRLLEKAEINEHAGVTSGFSLRWVTPDGLALNYTLRTEMGEGPLALLNLRDFELPENIFLLENAILVEEAE